MTEKQRAELKRTMLAEMEGLHAKIARIEEHVAPVAPDVAIGRISRMDTIMNQEINRSSLSGLKLRRVRLEYALRRISEPGFGECAECGEPIPMARLQAVPESDLCVQCAD